METKLDMTANELPTRELNFGGFLEYLQVGETLGQGVNRILATARAYGEWSWGSAHYPEVTLNEFGYNEKRLRVQMVRNRNEGFTRLPAVRKYTDELGRIKEGSMDAAVPDDLATGVEVDLGSLIGTVRVEIGQARESGCLEKPFVPNGANSPALQHGRWDPAVALISERFGRIDLESVLFGNPLEVVPGRPKTVADFARKGIRHWASCELKWETLKVSCPVMFKYPFRDGQTVTAGCKDITKAGGYEKECFSFAEANEFIRETERMLYDRERGNVRTCSWIRRGPVEWIVPPYGEGYATYDSPSEA